MDKVGLFAIFELNMLNFKWLDKKLMIVLEPCERERGYFCVVGSKEKCSSKFEEASLT